MEKNPEIPPELYGRWWKVINDEFGEIVEESGNDERETVQTENQETNLRKDRHQESSNYGEARAQKESRMSLTRREEENLSDYLNLGMTIDDARAAFQKEIETAELKQRIRENKRASTLGSIQSNSRTYLGPSPSTRGTGRGGLSFN
jgi:hypothetical protein